MVMNEKNSSSENNGRSVAIFDLLKTVLIREIPGFLELRSLDRLSGGASQETYCIELLTQDGTLRLAMRRASGGEQREISAQYPGLATEALLMRKASAAGVPEPEILYVLEPEDRLGDGFIMSWLEGFTLGAQIVKAPELEIIRPKLAFLFGETLARIHGIDVEKTGLKNHLQSVSPREYVEQTWDRYKAFGTAQPMIDFTARWLLENLPADYCPALVHNDYRNGNIMVDESGVVAVLDWEVAHIGDPMRDLGWMLCHSWRFGRSELPVGGVGQIEDFVSGYESVSGTKVDPERLLFWQVFGSFWWAVGCLSMAEHYRTGPDKTVERPAIGRRSSECQIDCVNLLIPGFADLVTNSRTEDPDQMPSSEELLKSVVDFLRGEVMSATEGRNRFLSRVAANSLDIVLRERQLGAIALENEYERLKMLLNEDSDQRSLNDLRWDLVHRLRDDYKALDQELLQFHLRSTVVNQIAIDQPKYPGFAEALQSIKKGGV